MRPVHLLVLVAILTFVPESQAFRIWFVKFNAPGLNNGSTWGNAFTALQPAIDAAVADDEIWVAAGTYKPTTTGDRTVAFVLKSGVRLRGGFAGTESILGQRNLGLHPTILSGDLLGNDGPNFIGRGDNSYNVLRGTSLNASTLLEGFIVRGGQADNLANSSQQLGAGIHLQTTALTMQSCIFRDNSARQVGSAISMFNSPAKLVNVAVYGNRNVLGSAVAISVNSPAEIRQCTIALNHTEALNYTGGLDAANNSGGPTISDSIFWGNTGGNATFQFRQLHLQLSPAATVTNCDVGNITPLPGVGNFNADPRFLDTLGSDGIAGTGDENLRLDRNSPCIDRTAITSLPTDNFDIDGDGSTAEPFPRDLAWQLRSRDDLGTGNQPGVTVDLGAYESLASSCPGDLNFDAQVNTADLVIFLAGFGSAGPHPLAGDMNADGAINTSDLTVFLANFGTNCNF